MINAALSLAGLDILSSVTFTITLPTLGPHQIVSFDTGTCAARGIPSRLVPKCLEEANTAAVGYQRRLPHAESSKS